MHDGASRTEKPYVSRPLKIESTWDAAGAVMSVCVGRERRPVVEEESWRARRINLKGEEGRIRCCLGRGQTTTVADPTAATYNSSCPPSLQRGDISNWLFLSSKLSFFPSIFALYFSFSPATNSRSIPLLLFPLLCHGTLLRLLLLLLPPSVKLAKPDPSGRQGSIEAGRCLSFPRQKKKRPPSPWRYAHCRWTGGFSSGLWYD